MEQSSGGILTGIRAFSMPTCLSSIFRPLSIEYRCLVLLDSVEDIFFFQEHYSKLRTVHHRVLLRIIGAQRKRPDLRTTSYNRALEITRCESIENTLRTRRILWAETLLRMGGGRLPKRVMFGNLEGAVRRGRSGIEKEWTDCVQSDIRAFGITGDWKTMALKAEVWVEAVTKGGRRFMAAWREGEEDAARHRQEKREATRLGKLQSHTGA